MRQLLAVAFLLSACSARSGEQLCQANIKSRLLNPETAEFFEFQQIDRASAEQLFQEMGLKARGIRITDRASYGPVIDAMADVANQTIGDLESEGAKFRTYRVKADSRVGLKVTSQHVCATSSDQCACFSEETF